MPGMPDAVAVRGEWISLLIVAVVLAASVRPLSQMLRLPQGDVGDLFWNGGLAFVVVGRLAYVGLESSEALTDPLVLIRIQGGIEPLAGLLGAGAILAWQTRYDPASRQTWLAAFAAGLVITVVTYDVACVARDACYGTTAPAPLGFAMSGLSETRLATPLIEAASLLLAAGALFSSALGVSRSLIRAWGDGCARTCGAYAAVRPGSGRGWLRDGSLRCAWSGGAGGRNPGSVRRTKRCRGRLIECGRRNLEPPGRPAGSKHDATTVDLSARGSGRRRRRQRWRLTRCACGREHREPRRRGDHRGARGRAVQPRHRRRTACGDRPPEDRRARAPSRSHRPTADTRT